jgi:GNAT superfamily N-acetyltransferase
MSEIRLAGLDDIPQLAALLGELFAQEIEFTPDRARQVEGLGRIIADASVGKILVGIQAGRAVGMVNLLYTVSTALGGRVAILEDMVVDPGARGRGLGSRLLDEAIRTCRADGCLRVTLLTDGDNSDAQRFYLRHGFERSTMVALRRLLVSRVGSP